MTSYFLRQLNHDGQLIDTKNELRVVHYSYENAKRMAYYIFRKYDQLYAIQGSDGSLEVLSADNAQKENS